MARTRAAKPAAEDARPAAVGKLLAETSLRGIFESTGRDESFASRVARRRLRFWRHACVRLEEAISSSVPFSVRVSAPV